MLVAVFLGRPPVIRCRYVVSGQMVSHLMSGLKHDCTHIFGVFRRSEWQTQTPAPRFLLDFYDLELNFG